jgi:hypothetical protein
MQSRSWFFVPLGVIQEAVEKIQDGALHEFWFNKATMSLQRK